ncbi:MAG: hypothetical protein HQK52_17595 [Oligoflexia bacterium]|nr:hypothetical protein [Oligoflexia bacterium]
MKSNHNPPIDLLIITALLLTLFPSCETAEQDTIARAQACLDAADRTRASACKNIVIGLETPDAYIIRCSADFLEAGMTASKMALAISNRDSTTTSNDPLLGMMGAFAFSSTEAAENAISDCNKSNNQSFILFASMAKMATTIGSFGTVLTTISSGATPTQQEMESALENLLNNPDTATLESIGATATLVNEQYCKDGTNPDANSKVCSNITEALNSSNSNSDIGQALLTALRTR